VSTAAATAVAFAVAAALSFFVPRRVRLLLVVAVLVVPIALGAPKFVRAERSDTRGRASTGAPVYSTPPPFRWRLRNPQLLAGIVEHVPAHESVSIVNGNLETGLTRWLAYSIAPRQLVDGPAKWTIVFRETPSQAGLHPAHAWHYGRDWLVER
jgi:hypothetical protein